jgi:hypothetical protein
MPPMGSEPSDAELTGDREDQETSMLALHLLQAALVHINTIFLQRILEDPPWSGRLTDADRRGLTPLFWSHVNPYGTFRLDMTRRIDLNRAGVRDGGGRKRDAGGPWPRSPTNSSRRRAPPSSSSSASSRGPGNIHNRSSAFKPL